MTDANDEPADACVCQGRYGSVEFAQMNDGTFPALEVWNDQRPKWHAKFMGLFRRISDDPNLQLRNRRQFRQVEGRLFEFKRNDVKSRMFAFRHEATWYLVHGFTGKKEDDLPAAEVTRAMRFMEEAMAKLNLR